RPVHETETRSMQYLLPASTLVVLLLLTGGPLPARAQETPAQSGAQAPPKWKPHPEVQALLDKADALATQKNWPDAEKGYDEALIAAHRLLDKYGEATTLFNLGNVHYFSGRPLKAMTSYEQAVPLYLIVGDKRGEAR